MSHVDDGALHAYLDGALGHLPGSEEARIREHLATCPACARRLDEERALRDEAHAILAGADPGAGPLPTLEELRDRARHTAVEPRPWLDFAPRRWAWAASVVLALGTGWLLRDRLVPASPSVITVPATSVEATRSPVPGDETGTRGRMAEAVEEKAVVAPSAGTGAPPRAARQALPAVPESEEAADRVVVVEEAPSIPDPAPDAPAAARERPGTPGLERLRDSLEARLGAPSSAVALEKSATAPAPSPASPMTAAGLPQLRDAVVEEALARRRLGEAAGDASPVRTVASFGDAAPPAVPGWPVLSITSGDARLPAGAVHVVQALGADTLDLVYVPGADEAPVLADGRWGDATEVAVPHARGWLVGRAHLSREAIMALLARVTGG